MANLKRRTLALVVVLLAGGALTAGLHAQRGGPAPAAQPSGPRPGKRAAARARAAGRGWQFPDRPALRADPAFTAKARRAKGPRDPLHDELG